MSGHSKWSQIKHQKEITDKKRGATFSKLLKAISIAAKEDPNLQFNFRLRAAVQKAKDLNVPNDNIERAIKRAADQSATLEELILEAYGEGGVAILIEVITDNRNRTIAEIKNILKKTDGKWAETGSVRWAFEENKSSDNVWPTKFKKNLDTENITKLKNLVSALEDHDDVQNVFTNTESN